MHPNVEHIGLISKIEPDDDVEVIRSRIRETQGDLLEKMGDLGDALQGKLSDSVTDLITTARTHVRETLDLRNQTRRHPLAMVAGSTVAGILLGGFVSRRAGLRRQPLLSRLASTSALAMPPLGRMLVLDLGIPLGLALLQRGVKKATDHSDASNTIDTRDVPRF